MLAKPFYNLHLLLKRQAYDGHFNYATNACLVRGYETLIIHIGESAHDELTVKTISNAAVARNWIAKVLDMEGPFDSRGEKSTKRSDQRGKCWEEENMELDWLNLNTGGYMCPCRGVKWRVVALLYENWIDLAFETGEEVRAEIIYGTNEVRGLDQPIAYHITEYDSKNPSSHKSFHGLFGG